MALIGYARVSTDGQNEARQVEAFKALGVDKVFIDKQSGKDAARPQLTAMREYVREGDTVIVTEYARLARSVRDLLTIVDELRGKGVQLISQKENFDTSTPQGKLMLTVFAGLAEFEREMILERQREGIAIAKAEGKYKGRQPKPDEPILSAARKWQKGTLTLKEAIKESGVSEATFFRRCKQNGICKEVAV